LKETNATKGLREKVVMTGNSWKDRGIEKVWEKKKIAI